MEIDLFEHFEMIQTGVFFKPQRRKANEGVRISHLDPETRMNSRDEFRQGTNIMMRAMRGVGVWPSTERAGGRRSSSMQSLSPGDPQHGELGGGGRHLCSLCHQDGGSLFYIHFLWGLPRIFAVLASTWSGPEGRNMLCRKNSINHWVKKLSSSKERSGKIKN